MKNTLLLAFALIVLSMWGRVNIPTPRPIEPQITPPLRTERPFELKGTFQTNETKEVTTTGANVTAGGQGQASQVGQFSFRYDGQINSLDGSRISKLHLVALNGESLYAEGIGQELHTPNSDVVTVIEVYHFTGGTGWLTNASGTFTVQRQLNIRTGATSGRFEGFILIP